MSPKCFFFQVLMHTFWIFLILKSSLFIINLYLGSYNWELRLMLISIYILLKQSFLLYSHENLRYFANDSKLSLLKMQQSFRLVLVLWQFLYPRIENIPSAGASDHLEMPCWSTNFNYIHGKRLTVLKNNSQVKIIKSKKKTIKSLTWHQNVCFSY